MKESDTIAIVAGGNETSNIPSGSTSRLGPSITMLRTQALPSRKSAASTSKNHVTSDSESDSTTKSGGKPRSTVRKSAKGRLSKTSSGDSEAWTTEMAKAIGNSLKHPHGVPTSRKVPAERGQRSRREPVASTIRHQGKGRELEFSDSDASVVAAPDVERKSAQSSSPAVPHPPLPEDAFEDSLWVDVDNDPPPASSASSPPLSTVTPQSRLRQSRTSSLWVGRSGEHPVALPGSRCYVGRKPEPSNRRVEGKKKEVPVPIQVSPLPLKLHASTQPFRSVFLHQARVC